MGHELALHLIEGSPGHAFVIDEEVDNRLLSISADISVCRTSESIAYQDVRNLLHLPPRHERSRVGQHERRHLVVQSAEFSVSPFGGFTNVPPPVGRNRRVERHLATGTGLGAGGALGATRADAIPRDREAVEFERDRSAFAAPFATIAAERVGTTTAVTKDATRAFEVLGMAVILTWLVGLFIDGVGQVGVTLCMLALVGTRWR
jgi:hypothetical protein